MSSTSKSRELAPLVRAFIVYPLNARFIRKYFRRGFARCNIPSSLNFKRTGYNYRVRARRRPTFFPACPTKSFHTSLSKNNFPNCLLNSQELRQRGEKKSADRTLKIPSLLQATKEHFSPALSLFFASFFIHCSSFLLDSRLPHLIPSSLENYNLTLYYDDVLLGRFRI